MRQPFPPDAIDEAILGCVAPAPEESNVARVVALRLGCGERTPAWTVQRNCGSGLQAVDCAAAAVASGRADLVLAGGTEAMSHAPVLFGRAMVEWLGRWARAPTLVSRGRLIAGLRPRYLAPTIGLLKGLVDPVAGLSMGQTAEQLAWRFGISRSAMDGYAAESHRRLGRALERGALAGEIAIMIDRDGQVYGSDDGYRPETDTDRLARLRPAFDRPVGAVTAGNGAQVTDGAAMLLLASARAVERHGLPILARVRDLQWAALDPAEMGLGPVHALAPLLARHGLSVSDLRQLEINEAFAAQVLACLAAWDDPAYRREILGLADPPDRSPDPIDRARLNPHGGAIAIGHPIGASGARLVLHLALSLKALGGGLGAASLCVGGGQGGAILIGRDRDGTGDAAGSPAGNAAPTGPGPARNGSGEGLA